MSYLARFAPRATPQSEPIPGSPQVASSAAGSDVHARLFEWIVRGGETAGLPAIPREALQSEHLVARPLADPADRGMLDVVGFDTATPQLIADFARGTL